MPVDRIDRRFAFAAAWAGVLWFAPLAVRADDPTGEQIYAAKCASCHGTKGEGTPDNYKDPLVGDRPLKDLAKLIDDTMPEGEPEMLSAEESAKVAAYVYDAFYSPMAQVRNKPARVELSRLTVRQYQNAVADLLGSFGWNGNWGDERGLKAEYFKARVCANRHKVFERVDPTVDFSYGEGSPDTEKIQPEEFAVAWSGSVFAPETGDYEFVVDTENGMRLWVNDRDKPIIDVTVKSGDQTEYRQSIRLLGGRAYPLRLEIHKSKSEKTAFIHLKWKPPHQADEVIPARCLSTSPFPETLVVETPFPPDDRSTGYERGTTISKEWDSATTFAAIEVANKIVTNADGLAGTKADAGDRADKLKAFCRTFAERAFRRPLSDEVKQVYVEKQFAESPDPPTAVRRVVLLTLKSPRFLYREVGAPQPDAFTAASRLSFGLWDSMPDKQLLEAAANNQLQTPEQVRSQAGRMLTDLRTKAKVREFLHQWLQFERFRDMAKEPSLYPEFDAALASDLRTSLDLFLDEVLWTGDGDFRRLLLDDSVYLNGRLAKFYGVDLPADAEFQKVSLDPQARAGILTHPYLMSGFAYYSTTSPIHRGVFVARSLLGRSLKPPPEAVTPVAPDLHPDLTTRERTVLQTSPAACVTCHTLINPLGFPLERFDAVGRLRGEEKGKPIDATGGYLTQSGQDVQFTGAKELANFLVSSEETQSAFVKQLFQYVVKQPVQAYGPDRLADLRRSFAENGFDVRKLLVEIVTASALNAGRPKE
jgi:mono/diheme cytochrome c family protein